MIDRAIGLFGLALTIILGLWSLAPANWPKLPPWATFLGAGFGVLLVGLAAGLIFGEYRRPPAPPSLGLSLNGGNIFDPDAPDLKNKAVGLGLDVHVWNTGGPTYVTKWGLLVFCPNRTPIIAQLIQIQEMLRVGGPINSSVLRSAEDLSVRSAEKPIELAPTSGKLLFFVQIDRKFFENAGTRLELTATDSYGTETRVEKALGEWMKR